MKKSVVLLLATLGVMLSPAAGLSGANKTAKDGRLGYVDDPKGHFNIYFGDLHSHTIFSGDHGRGVSIKMGWANADHTDMTDPAYWDKLYALPGDQPADAYDNARRLGMDFLAVSDHSNAIREYRFLTDFPGAPLPKAQSLWYEHGFTDAHWLITKTAAQAKNDPGKFVAIAAFEYSNNNGKGNEDGHMNIFNTDDWQTALGPQRTYTWLFTKILPQVKALAEARPADDWRGPRIVVQFNHPGINDYDNWLNLVNPRTIPARGKEPTNFNQFVRDFEYNFTVASRPAVYEKVLNLGWKVAPAMNSDIHGVPNYTEAHRGSGVLATELSTKAIMEAIYQRRIYATLMNAPVELDFRLNGYVMGYAFASRPARNFVIDTYAKSRQGDEVTRVEVFAGKYATDDSDAQVTAPHKMIASMTVSAANPKATVTLSGSDSVGYDFYYIKAYRGDTLAAISAPIWMDNQ